MHPSSAPSTQVKQTAPHAKTQPETSPFDPANVIERGAQIAADIKKHPALFYELWCSMRSLIANLGGPDEAWRLFQQSPLANMELPSHQARLARIGEGGDRVFYNTFDVEDLGALIQLYVATHGTMPHPVPDLQISPVGRLRDRVVQALRQLRATVDMSGEA